MCDPVTKWVFGKLTKTPKLPDPVPPKQESKQADSEVSAALARSSGSPGQSTKRGTLLTGSTGINDKRLKLGKSLLS